MLKRAEGKPADSKVAEAAAIAAGVFAALGSTEQQARNGAGVDTRADENTGANWKSASRREALR
jgi:hypothetical protein